MMESKYSMQKKFETPNSKLYNLLAILNNYQIPLFNQLICIWNRVNVIEESQRFLLFNVICTAEQQ